MTVLFLWSHGMDVSTFVDDQDKKHLFAGVVYMITIGQRFYIGSAKNLSTRIVTHIRLLQAGKHYNKYMQAAFTKHGAARFSVIELLPKKCDKHLQMHIEQHYLDLLSKDTDCMNLKRTSYYGGATTVRRIMIDGKVYDTAGEAAASIGVARSAFNNWIQGYAALPPKYWHHDIRFADGECKVRRNSRSKPVVVNGKTFPSMVDAAKSLGVDRSVAHGWITGKLVVPAGIDIRLVGDNERHTQKTTDTRNSRVIMNGVLYGSVQQAAAVIGVSKTTVSLWMKGHTVIPLRHGITELRYVDKETNLKARQRLPKRQVEMNGVLYESLTEAGKVVGVKSRQVCAWLRGREAIPAKYNIHSLHYA